MLIFKFEIYKGKDIHQEQHLMKITLPQGRIAQLGNVQSNTRDMSQAGDQEALTASAFHIWSHRNNIHYETKFNIHNHLISWNIHMLWHLKMSKLFCWQHVQSLTSLLTTLWHLMSKQLSKGMSKMSKISLKWFDGMSILAFQLLTSQGWTPEKLFKPNRWIIILSNSYYCICIVYLLTM